MASRRDFIKKGLILAGSIGMIDKVLASPEQKTITYDKYPVITKFPTKRDDMILYAERPPLLETPRKYFAQAITPNDAFFVRWHLSDIPTKVDIKKWRLKIRGNVEREVELSMEDLKTKFEPVSFYAVSQCSGNGRSYFQEKRLVAGIQWKLGAMGNALWTGVRLADVLNYAGVKCDSIEVAFNGLDKAPYPKTPDFVRSLPIDKCLYEDLILAYEMNGEEIPLLNGYPLRLIVPGWYATHWIKSLSEIIVLNKELKNFWMEKAYHLPDNACHGEEPDKISKKRRIISFMNVKSVIGTPEDNTVVKLGEVVKVSGVAFDRGYGIRAVLISLDNGKTWKPTSLAPDLGRYSFREWVYYFRPNKRGTYKIMVKAINKNNETQPYKVEWNKGGYMWNGLDSVTIKVV